MRTDLRGVFILSSLYIGDVLYTIDLAPGLPKERLIIEKAFLAPGVLQK